MLAVNCHGQEVIRRYENSTGGVIDLKKDNRFVLNRKFGNKHTIIPGGISEGKWSIKKDNLIVLNSDYQFNKFGEPIISINVNQKRFEDNKIIIDFDNIESYLNIQKRKGLKIELQLNVNDELVDVFEMNDSLESIKVNKLVDEFDSVNFYLIFKKKCSECSIPDMNNFYIGEFDSDIGNNRFVISLPKFKESSFSYIYMLDEFLFLEENKIHWNGEVYIKQEN